MSDPEQIKVFVSGGQDFLSAKASGFQRGILVAAIFDRLFHKSFNSDELIPGLLKSWKYEDNGKRWILTLKSGLTFHNGREVCSKDLEFTLGNILTAKITTPERSLMTNIKGSHHCPRGVAYSSGMISGLKLIDDVSLEISLQNAEPRFIERLGAPTFAPIPEESVSVANDVEESACSGAFLRWKKTPIGAGAYKD